MARRRVGTKRSWQLKMSRRVSAIGHARWLPPSWGTASWDSDPNCFPFFWKLFLESGPNVGLLRWRLRATRGFVTDFGTESHLADAQDCLQEFLESTGSTLRVEPERYLFPLALYFTGWHHVWDHIAQVVSETVLNSYLE